MAEVQRLQATGTPTFFLGVTDPQRFKDQRDEDGGRPALRGVQGGDRAPPVFAEVIVGQVAGDSRRNPRKREGPELIGPLFFGCGLRLRSARTLARRSYSAQKPLMQE